MRNIYILFFAFALAVGCMSCNDEWEDEQFVQNISFKAEPNANGVTFAHLRYNLDGTVRYELPIIVSGSTMNSQNRTVHIALDPDTLKTLNREQYGGREPLYFKQLDPEYYSFPETVEIPAGQNMAILPIDIKLGGENNTHPLDQSDKWVLPLTIVDDPLYDYQANPRKHYRKALLRINPFNDYSGEYAATQYAIYLNDSEESFKVSSQRSYVVDDKTIFIYAGLRDIDYLDRKDYKLFIKFTDDIIDIQRKKLEIWSDNKDQNKLAPIPGDQSYYTIDEEWDAKKPYLKHIYITLYLAYTFEDYSTVPNTRLRYKVQGTLSMQRDLNTLIPDEDQQIQW